MEQQWQTANAAINAALEAGKAMEAFEKYYAEEVTMQENDTELRVGKDLNREMCGGFLNMHPDLTLQVLSVAFGNQLSMQEVLFDYTNKSGEKVTYTEVAVRHWANNQVVQEKFYYAA